MSMGLSIFLATERDIIGSLGCRDDDLLGAILEESAEELEYLDEEFNTDDDDCGPGITFAQALRELFAGEFTKPRPEAYVYTYAFEMVLLHFGGRLSNSQFCPCKSGWLDHLDGLLQGGGVSLRLRDLLYRSPFRRPYREALTFGHWKHDEALLARPALQELVSGLKDKDERKALKEVSGWVKAACDEPGGIVMAVYS